MGLSYFFSSLISLSLSTYLNPTHPLKSGSRRGRAGVGRALLPVGMRGWADSGLGPRGHPGAGLVATAEARGAAGAGGCETDLREIRSSSAGAGLPPREGARASVLGQRGARVTACPAQRPPPRTEARRRPGATKCRGSSGWWKELGPALPKMHCGRA